MSDWVEVNANNATWDQEKPIQGIYKRSVENVGPNNSMQHILATDDGEVAVWGSTVLDGKFEQIPAGAEVRVEFLGKEKSAKGVEYKNYKVQYRETQANEVFPGAEVV